MERLEGKRYVWSQTPHRRRVHSGVSAVGHLVVAGLVYIVCQQVFSSLGMGFFPIFLLLAFLGSIYTVLSFRDMSIPFTVWILTIGGFRFLFTMEVSGLPDLYLDRLAMLWLTIIFMVKFFAMRRWPKGPYLLDAFVFLHAVYILVLIYFKDMAHFNLWTKSFLTPTGAYFLAKNIVVDMKRIRLLLTLLLILSVYYNITSIAEKFDIIWLLWPKSMILDHEEFVGRSCGPFRQAPLFGTIIGMILPIHLYFVATARNNFLKSLLLLSFGIGFASLYFTYTRGSWLAGVVAFIAVIMLNRKTYLRTVLPIIILVPILATTVLGLAQDKFLKERVENENTLDARVGTLVTVFRVWKSSPIFGVGFFQYQNVREDFVQALEVPILGTVRFKNFRHNSIHDIYFGPLAEEGLLGAGMQFFIYLMLYRIFRKKFALRKQGDHFATYIMPILAGIFLGYLAGGIAIDYRFFAIPGTLFMMSAGILCGYDEQVKIGQGVGVMEP